jgi:hypothetical protein
VGANMEGADCACLHHVQISNGGRSKPRELEQSC